MSDTRYLRDVDGVQRPEENVEAALRARIPAALAANAAHLAAPRAGTTAARVADLEAQVDRLTRQVSALARLATGRLDTAD